MQVADEARARVDAWLRGEEDRFVLDLTLFEAPDVLESLESADEVAYATLYCLALASAIVAERPTEADAPPDAIRHAPFDVQLLWYSASSVEPSRIRIGRAQIVMASDSLPDRGVWEVSEQAAAEEMARRHELDFAYQVTPHTGSAKLAFHDHGGTFDLRWNRGDDHATWLRFDDESERRERSVATEFVLHHLLGIRHDHTKALKKKADTSWNPAHRRLWELAAFLGGRRRSVAEV